MDPNSVRGLTNLILFEIDFAPDIRTPGPPAARLAEAIVGGKLFHGPAAEYLEAVDAVLANGELPEAAAHYSEKYDADELLALLRVLADELRPRLRPGRPTG